jgi:outer membrane protein OmpA-like peptidoglycan-associated protein
VRRVLLAGLFAASLSGCAPQAIVVVLPEPDGSSGAVTVSDGQGSVLLDRPYAAGEVSRGKVSAASSDRERVEKMFGDALAAQPILPSRFRLYFEWDSNTMTADSKRRYGEVFADIRRRSVYQVEVVGHTDTFGEKQYNHQLSLERAKSIRDLLVRDGLDREAISIAGRGELDPVVKTADRVSEPQNRRVEITVR